MACSMRIRDVFSPCLKAWLLLSVSALGACGGSGSPQPTGTTPPPTQFSVGGTVAGLAGTGLVLQLNGGNDLQQATNGSFTLSPELASGSTFAVTVKVQPSHPSQTCSVPNKTGTI